MRTLRGRARRVVETAADATPEADLQEYVRQVALYVGRFDRYYHAHDARHSPAGFPDVLAIRTSDGRKLVAELKREGEHPEPDQEAWLEAFRLLGWETYVWRPSQLEEIERILAR